MTVNMHVRDVPDHVHEELLRRAALQGMSLRQYTLHVLGEHCAIAPVDEWMDRIARRRARWLAEGRDVKVDAAQAVRASRQEDEEQWAQRG
jgi:plasmid stability protein